MERKLEIQKASVEAYFRAHPEQWKKVEAFLQLPVMSLRLLDFFVTCYARKYSCEYVTKDGALFNVYQSMQSVLLGINKSLMDPFKRGKCAFEFNGRQTNVAQMNFFRWCAIYDVFDYVAKHHEKIRDEMQLVHRTPDTKSTLVAVALPPKLLANESPKDLKRIMECLRDRMQGPKKRRRRLVPEQKKGHFSAVPVKIDSSVL